MLILMWGYDESWRLLGYPCLKSQLTHNVLPAIISPSLGDGVTGNTPDSVLPAGLLEDFLLDAQCTTSLDFCQGLFFAVAKYTLCRIPFLACPPKDEYIPELF